MHNLALWGKRSELALQELEVGGEESGGVLSLCPRRRQRAGRKGVVAVYVDIIMKGSR